MNRIALAIAVLANVLAILALSGGGPTPARLAPQRSSLEAMRDSRTIRAGYSGFRPYTIVKPGSTGPPRIEGLCADMLYEIASREDPPWVVEWHQVTFETLRADMVSGRFDVFADAVYQTIPRATDFAFTIPYSFFGVAVGLVRRGDNRFKDFRDLDRPGVVISLAEGWTSTAYARQHLVQPELRVLPVGDDPFVQLNEVVLGRADVALQDVPTVLQFARAHPNEVEALWIDRPPMRVPAAFMTRQGDPILLEFLNASIRILDADGTLERLDRKWKALSEFPVLQLREGAGLNAE